ncbi:MAG: DegV family protein [Anaerolineaceae bacterium]
MRSLIDIKPVLTIDKEGTLDPISKQRGEKQALQAMVDYTARKVKGGQKYYLAVLEADCPEDAARLEGMVLQKLKPEEVFHTELTPVMGVHIGPGAIDLGYYYE